MSTERRRLVDQLKKARSTLEDVRAYFVHTRHGREWISNGGLERESIDERLDEIQRVLRDYEE